MTYQIRYTDHDGKAQIIDRESIDDAAKTAMRLARDHHESLRLYDLDGSLLWRPCIAEVAS